LDFSQLALLHQDYLELF
jgi:hypothetical protein